MKKEWMPVFNDEMCFKVFENPFCKGVLTEIKCQSKGGFLAKQNNWAPFVDIRGYNLKVHDTYSICEFQICSSGNKGLILIQKDNGLTKILLQFLKIGDSCLLNKIELDQSLIGTVQKFYLLNETQFVIITRNHSFEHSVILHSLQSSKEPKKPNQTIVYQSLKGPVEITPYPNQFIIKYINERSKVFEYDHVEFNETYQFRICHLPLNNFHLLGISLESKNSDIFIVTQSSSSQRNQDTLFLFSTKNWLERDVIEMYPLFYFDKNESVIDIYYHDGKILVYSQLNDSRNLQTYIIKLDDHKLTLIRAPKATSISNVTHFNNGDMIMEVSDNVNNHYYYFNISTPKPIYFDSRQVNLSQSEYSSDSPDEIDIKPISRGRPSFVENAIHSPVLASPKPINEVSDKSIHQSGNDKDNQTPFKKYRRHRSKKDHSNDKAEYSQNEINDSRDHIDITQPAVLFSTVTSHKDKFSSTPREATDNNMRSTHVCRPKQHRPHNQKGTDNNRFTPKLSKTKTEVRGNLTRKKKSSKLSEDNSNYSSYKNNSV